MTLLFYAQPELVLGRTKSDPGNISAEGFYFRSAEEYEQQAKTLKNQYGDAVEEFEIQFIDGEAIYCDLAKAWGVNQANLAGFFDAIDVWSEDWKTRYIIAVGECGYSHDQVADDPEAIDLTIYQVESLRDLAEQFVDEGLYGDIPERLRNYLDYDAIARDLGHNYSETTIAGTHLVYGCA